MAGRPRLECSGGNMRAAFLAGERVRTERETKRFCQECRHVPTESVRPAVPSGGSYAVSCWRSNLVLPGVAAGISCDHPFGDLSRIRLISSRAYGAGNPNEDVLRSGMLPRRP